MDPIAVVAIFGGGLIALMGYRMFLDMLRLWGLLVAGVFGALIVIFAVPGAGGPFHLSVPLAVGFILGGIIGVIFANPLKVVIVFLTGLLAGGLLGTVGYNMVTGTSNLLLAVGLGAALGLIAIRFEDVVLIVSTAFLGAAAVMYGLTLLMTIDRLIAIIIFFLLGFFGAAAQYQDTRTS
jgi:hypothetical protein